MEERLPVSASGRSAFHAPSVGRTVLCSVPWALLLAGALVFAPTRAFADFGGGIFTDALCDLYELLQGSMGAFFFSSALLVGIAAAAMGHLSQIKAALIVGVACLSVNATVSMHSAFDYLECGVAANPAAPPRTVGATAAAERQIIESSESPTAFNPEFATPESEDE